MNKYYIKKLNHCLFKWILILEARALRKCHVFDTYASAKHMFLTIKIPGNYAYYYNSALPIDEWEKYLK